MIGKWYQELLDALNVNGKQMDQTGGISLTAQDIPASPEGTVGDALQLLTPIYLTQAEYDRLAEGGGLLRGREYRILEG